jgi:hypothetical protein
LPSHDPDCTDLFAKTSRRLHVVYYSMPQHARLFLLDKPA